MDAFHEREDLRGFGRLLSLLLRVHSVVSDKRPDDVRLAVLLGHPLAPRGDSLWRLEAVRGRDERAVAAEYEST